MPQVTMPQLGEGVEQGTIGKWLKAVGDHVRIGDPLVEVVTDKVNAEVPSPFEGTLTRILVGEGETIANDVAIAEVETGGAPAAGAPAADAPAAGAPAAGAAAAGAAAAAQVAPSVDGRSDRASSAARPRGRHCAALAAAPAAATAAPAAAPRSPAVHVPSGIRMTPAVRRLARRARRGRHDHHRLRHGRPHHARRHRACSGWWPGAAARSQAPRTGEPPPLLRGHRTAASAPLGPLDSPVRDGDSLKQLSPMRKAIAAQMTRSLEVPAAYITVEVDMTPVVRARAAAQRRLQGARGHRPQLRGLRHQGLRGGPAQAPRPQRPLDAGGPLAASGHQHRHRGGGPDGLVVPVIHKAQDLSLHGAQRGHQRPGRPRPQQAAAPGGPRRAARSRWTTPAGPARS